MLDPAIDLAGPAVHTMVSWLGTYFVHSTVLVGSVWAFTRFLPLDALTRSLLWKMSLVGGLFTATLQTGLGVEPLFGSVSVEAGSVAPEVPPPLAAVPAPPPPQVREFSAPVFVQHAHGCVGCEPQVLVVSDEGVTVQADGGRILIKRVRPKGGDKQPATAWAAAVGLAPGAVIGETLAV